jgi:hypothetical protein
VLQNFSPNFLLKYSDVTSEGGIVEPEETSIASQRLSKHVPAATNAQALIEVFLEMVFSIRIRANWL